MINFVRIIFILALVACAACGKFRESDPDPRPMGQNCKINPERFKLFFKENIASDIACLELNFRDYYTTSVKRQHPDFITYQEVQKFIATFYGDIDPQLPEAFRLVFKINGFFFNNVGRPAEASSSTPPPPEQINQNLYTKNIDKVFQILHYLNQAAAQLYPILTGPPAAHPLEYQARRALWGATWQELGRNLLALLPPPAAANNPIPHNVLDLAQLWQTIQEYWLATPATPIAAPPSSSLALDLFYSLKVHLLGGEAALLTYPEAYQFFQHNTDWPFLFFDLLYARPALFAQPQDYFALVEQHLLALLTTPIPPRGKEFALADDLRPWLGILLHQVIPSLPDTAIQNFTSNIVARLMQRFPGLTATGPLPDDLRQYFQGQILYLIVLEYFGHWQLAHQEVFFATPTALEPYWQFSLPRDGPRPAAQEATEKLTQLQQAWETQQALWFPAELRQKLVGDAAADRFSYAYLNGQLHALLAQQQYDGQGPTFKWQKQVAFTAPNLGMSIFYHWAAQLVLDFYQHIFQTTAQALYGPFLPGQFDVVGTPSAALALTPQLMEPIFADLWPIIETFNLPQQRDQQGLIQAIFYVGDLLLFNSDGSGALTTPELAQLWPFIYAATNLGKIFWENLAHFCPAQDTLLLADGTEDFSYAKDCWHQHFLAILAQLQMTNPNHPIPTIYLEGSANFWQSLQAADQQGNSKRGTDAYLRRLEQVMMIGPDRTEFRFQEILLTSAALLATENFYLRFDLPDENGERNQVLQKDELNAVYRLVRTTIKNNVLPGKDFDEQYARSLFDYVLEKKSLPLNWRGKAKMWWYHHWSQHSALSLTRFDFLDLAIMLKNPDVMTILKRNNFAQPPPADQSNSDKLLHLGTEYLKELVLGAKDRPPEK